VFILVRDAFLLALLLLRTYCHGRGWLKNKLSFSFSPPTPVTPLQHLLKPFVLGSRIAPQTQEITKDHTGGIPLTRTTGGRNLLNFWPSSQARLTLSPGQSFSPAFLQGSRPAHPIHLWYNRDDNPSQIVVLVAIEVHENLACEMNCVTQSSIFQVIYETNIELSYYLAQDSLSVEQFDLD